MIVGQTTSATGPTQATALPTWPMTLVRVKLNTFIQGCQRLNQGSQTSAAHPQIWFDVGGECGVPFWKRMLMPVNDHPWVDAQAQRRAPEWYSYNYGPVR